MIHFQTHTSTIDSSVNFSQTTDNGMLEARYVRREQEYFICYVSSFHGCNQLCNFCHLTNTKQFDMTQATLEDFRKQIDVVFDQYYEDNKGAKYAHLNFMSRGEPLLNNEIVNNSQSIFEEFFSQCRVYGIGSKVNISTIMPTAKKKTLVEMFPSIHPTIYYSLYSVDPKFREKWMPNAMGVYEALQELQEYQKLSKKTVKLHYALIEGENDSLDDAVEILHVLEKFKLHVELNIVRYNPYSALYGKEPPESVIENYARVMRLHPKISEVKIIPRVRFDVKASCGMFLEGNIKNAGIS